MEWKVEIYIFFFSTYFQIDRIQGIAILGGVDMENYNAVIDVWGYLTRIKLGIEIISIE